AGGTWHTLSSPGGNGAVTGRVPLHPRATPDPAGAPGSEFRAAHGSAFGLQSVHWSIIRGTSQRLEGEDRSPIIPLIATAGVAARTGRPRQGTLTLSFPVR